MWVDTGGVTHSTAMPDPLCLLTPAYAGAFEDLVLRDRDGVQDVLGRCLRRFFDEPRRRPAADEARFVEAVPPWWLMYGSPVSLEEFHDGLAALDDRWQLDVVEGLGDLVSSVGRRRPRMPAVAMPEEVRRYDGRAAEVIRVGEVVGRVVIGAGWTAERVSGRLWWTKFSSPKWGATIWTEIAPPGGGEAESFDEVATPEQLTELLRQWDESRFESEAESLELRWLSRIEGSDVVEQMLEPK